MTRRMLIAVPALALILALAGTASAEARDHGSRYGRYGRSSGYSHSYRYRSPRVYVAPTYGYYNYGYDPYYYAPYYGPYYRSYNRYPYGYSRYAYRPRYRRPNFSIHIGF